MTFDPTKPANNSPITSAELRNQLNALKALIDAKLSAETDPVFAASEARLFVPGDKAKLNSALQTETEPAFAASEARLFAAGDKAKLDTLTPSGPATGTYATRAVVIGTAYQPSLAHDVLVIARVYAMSRTASEDGELQVYSDAANPPTIERARATAYGGPKAVKTGTTLTFVVKKANYYKFANTSGPSGVAGIVGDVMEFPINL